MKALLYSTTDEDKNNLPKIIAVGDSRADPEISRPLASSIASLAPEWDQCRAKFFVGEELIDEAKDSDKSCASVISMLTAGHADAVAISVKENSAVGYRVESWAIRDIPGYSARQLLVASAPVRKKTWIDAFGILFCTLAGMFALMASICPPCEESFYWLGIGVVMLLYGQIRAK